MKTISLTQGKEALVSDCDYEFLMQWKWRYAKCNKCPGGYAVRSGPRPLHEVIYMHKLIADREGLSGEIDHEDRNKLNNQRRNLRSATRFQNLRNCGLSVRNRSGFKGVCWDERTRMWRAQVGHQHLGRFPGTEAGRRTAAHAYNKAAVKDFGEFAVLNAV